VILEASGTQAIVVGPAAVWALAALAGLFLWIGRYFIVQLHEHKLKTEAELSQKVSKDELRLNLQVVVTKLDLMLESNEKQIEGRAEFIAWSREQKQKSRYPGAGDGG
jgi:hypothetical protein